MFVYRSVTNKKLVHLNWKSAQVLRLYFVQLMYLKIPELSLVRHRFSHMKKRCFEHFWFGKARASLEVQTVRLRKVWVL